MQSAFDSGVCLSVNLLHVWQPGACCCCAWSKPNRNPLRPHQELIAHSRLVPGGRIRGHGCSPAERGEERQSGGQHSCPLQDQRRGIYAAACLTHLPDGCLCTAAWACPIHCLQAPRSVPAGCRETSILCSGCIMSLCARFHCLSCLHVLCLLHVYMLSTCCGAVRALGCWGLLTQDGWGCRSTANIYLTHAVRGTIRGWPRVRAAQAQMPDVCAGRLVPIQGTTRQPSSFLQHGNYLHTPMHQFHHTAEHGRWNWNRM